MELFTSMFLLSVYAIHIVLADDGGDDFSTDYGSANYDRRFHSNGIPGGNSERLDDFDSGDRLSLSDLSHISTHGRIENDVWEVKFTRHALDLLRRKIIVGQRNSMNQILDAALTFYDENDAIVRDGTGNQIHYSSSPHDLGHLLVILHDGFAFSYAKCRLRLKPNCDFDPDTVFFHFSESSSMTRMAACSDGIRNRDETGQDCGGVCASIRKCPDGSGCAISTDCKSAVCISNICLPAHCQNNKHDNGESDLDCGGPCALEMKCSVSKACNVSCDCESDVCVSKICLPMHCNNGQKDSGEVGSDCGGPCAGGRKCSNHGECNTSTDCISGLCDSNFCLPDHCNSGTQDLGESDVDCGGPCAPSKKCPTLSTCNVTSDCRSDICNSGICDIGVCTPACEENKVCLYDGCLRVGYFSISAVWSRPGDGELYVQTPLGSLIYHNNEREDNVTRGGELADDVTEGLGPENIYWNKNRPSSGNYNICFTSFDHEPITVTFVIRKETKPIQRITKIFQRPLENELHACDYSKRGYVGSVEYP